MTVARILSNNNYKVRVGKKSNMYWFEVLDKNSGYKYLGSNFHPHYANESYSMLKYYVNNNVILSNTKLQQLSYKPIKVIKNKGQLEGQLSMDLP